MRLQRNTGRKNHRQLLDELIRRSERCVLCSGWLKHAGLKLLLPAIDDAIARGAQVLVYSNRQHTEAEAATALYAREGVRHMIADDEIRYLHTKLYYFENGERYTAVIGSANITKGGLVDNEECSVVLSGKIGDAGQAEIDAYLTALPLALRQPISKKRPPKNTWPMPATDR